MRRTTITLTALGFAAAALAQTPNNLIALTRATPLIAQRDHNTCTPLPVCNPPGFPPAFAQPYAGGTAWDPIRNGVWISNGALLADVDPNTCAYICPPSPAPLVSPNAVVTGLEMLESINQVWMLDSFGNLYQMTYACPPAVTSICNTGLPLTATNATGGLAVDEKNRLVFYTYSNWVTGATQLHIATMGAPCATIQVVNVTPCTTGVPLNGVTGLGVDACRQILYLTDGINTMGWTYNVLPGPVLVFGLQTCCNLPPPAPGDLYVGLAVRSGRATPFGGPCANGVCPLCPMVHTLVNSPNLGNLSFALSLTGAPLGNLAWCNIGGGACSPNLAFPPLCGPLFTGPSLGLIGPVPTGVGAGCGGSATFPLALPMIPPLCGAIISSQCIVLCSGGGAIGTSLSNCLSWEIQSN
ncbi:MAG TPA: hypothetical protein VK348_13270 [Planctomycetota bacterium]|nr:hypothetical protein [Planctomycetota bacterium]